MQDVIVITGATATGKSDVAVALAKKIGGEIVNADSVQVYRDFNIAACKPSAELFAQVPHHIYDCCDPKEGWNVGRFVKEAGSVIAEIAQRNVVPIVVGGSGLYIRSLLTGLINAPEASARSKAIVESKIAALQEQGLQVNEVSQALHAWLGALDLESQKSLHCHDRTRIVRALLVNLTIGKSVAALRELHRSRDWQYRALVFSLSYDREQLYSRVNQRVEKMLSDGLLNEARELEVKYGRAAQPFQSIGYKQALQYIDGQIDQPTLVDRIQCETRRFAKRQLTWWRNQPEKLGWEVAPQMALERGDLAEAMYRDVAQFLGKSVDSQVVAPIFRNFQLT